MGWPSIPLILFSNHAEYWVETDAAMHSSQFERVGLIDAYCRNYRFRPQPTLDMLDAAHISISILK